MTVFMPVYFVLRSAVGLILPLLLVVFIPIHAAYRDDAEKKRKFRMFKKVVTISYLPLWLAGVAWFAWGDIQEYQYRTTVDEKVAWQNRATPDLCARTFMEKIDPRDKRIRRYVDPALLDTPKGEALVNWHQRMAREVQGMFGGKTVNAEVMSQITISFLSVDENDQTQAKVRIIGRFKPQAKKSGLFKSTVYDFPEKRFGVELVLVNRNGQWYIADIS